MITYPFDPYCGPALDAAEDQLGQWLAVDYSPTDHVLARSCMEAYEWTFADDVPSEYVCAHFVAWKQTAQRVLADAGMRPTDGAAC